MNRLNPEDPRANYVQIADLLESGIRSGAFDGGKLPAHHQVADDFGVSIGTVKRAYAKLQDDQLIVTRQGQGSYVRQPLPGPRSAAGDGGDLDDVYDQIATIRRLLDSVEQQLRSRG